MRDLENFVSSNGYKVENSPLPNAIRETFDFKRNEKNRKRILDTLNKQMEELRSIAKKSLKPELDKKKTDNKETMTGIREYFSFENKNQNLYIVLGVGLALFLLCLYIYRRC